MSDTILKSLPEIKEQEEPDNTLSLETQLAEQKQLVKRLESKLEKIFEDFNYNVQLIYDRDIEIDKLNSKIETLTDTIREQKLQLQSMQGLYMKVKQLEADKQMLNKRLEAFMSVDKNQSVTQKRSDYKSQRMRLPQPRSYSDGQFLLTEESAREPDEADSVPLTRINTYLETRIKALEQETHNKKERKTQPGSKTDRISNKEQEISELIKSLSPYKKDTIKTPARKSFDTGFDLLIKNVQRINVSTNPVTGLAVQNDGSSVVRCVSPFECGLGDLI